MGCSNSSFSTVAAMVMNLRVDDPMTRESARHSTLRRPVRDPSGSLGGEEPILLRECLDDDVLEADLLRYAVRVELQADRAFLDPVGLGVAPVDHGLAVDGDADPVA